MISQISVQEAPSPSHGQKRLTIVTTTRNCIDIIEGYVSSFTALDTRLFDWVVIDAASTDGTREFLKSHANLFSWFVSEPDQGTYFGLNKAISKVKTKYYVVFGADDRPSISLLDDLKTLLEGNAAMILGATRLNPSGEIKLPGPRWMHTLTWGRVVSHHSVGTIIRTDLHRKYGVYDTTYRVVADGAFLKRILLSSESIYQTVTILGDYCENGFSGRQELLSIWETFLVQTSAGSNILIQLILLNLRFLKLKMCSRFRSVTP